MYTKQEPSLCAEDWDLLFMQEARLVLKHALKENNMVSATFIINHALTVALTRIVNHAASLCTTSRFIEWARANSIMFDENGQEYSLDSYKDLASLVTA